jgi:hypothetical protein
MAYAVADSSHLHNPEQNSTGKICLIIQVSYLQIRIKKAANLAAIIHLTKI